MSSIVCLGNAEDVSCQLLSSLFDQSRRGLVSLVRQLVEMYAVSFSSPKQSWWTDGVNMCIYSNKCLIRQRKVVKMYSIPTNVRKKWEHNLAKTNSEVLILYMLNVKAKTAQVRLKELVYMFLNSKPCFTYSNTK